MDKELANWLKSEFDKVRVIRTTPKDLLIDKKMIVSCKYCEEQFGISQYDVTQAGYVISHKTCIRHLPKYFAIMTGEKEPQFSQALKKYLPKVIERFNENHGKDEAKDLARTENKEILDWFKHPIPIT